MEEAALRALVYIRMPEGSIDERGFAMLKLIRASRPAAKRVSPARFKEMLREQYLLVGLDEGRAIEALPKLLGEDAAARRAALDTLHQVLAARGMMSDEGRRRLVQVEALFSAPPKKVVKSETAHV